MLKSFRAGFVSVLFVARLVAGEGEYDFSAAEAAIREAIAAKMEALYGHRYDPAHEITVTAGATQAILSAVPAGGGAGSPPGGRYGRLILFEDPFFRGRPYTLQGADANIGGGQRVESVQISGGSWQICDRPRFVRSCIDGPVFDAAAVVWEELAH